MNHRRLVTAAGAQILWLTYSSFVGLVEFLAPGPEIKILCTTFYCLTASVHNFRKEGYDFNQMKF